MENTKEEAQKTAEAEAELDKLIKQIEEARENFEWEQKRLGKKMHFLAQQNKMLIGVLMKINATAELRSGNLPHIDMIITKTLNDLEDLQKQFMQEYIKE